MDLDAKEISNHIFLKISAKNKFQMEIEKKYQNIFEKKIWKKSWSSKKTKNKNWVDQKFQNIFKFQISILSFEFFEIFQIFLFWNFIFFIFKILEKIRFSKFEISKNSDFIGFSKVHFVTNTHSILTNDTCMNIYIIRRIVSTCQNIHTVIIKEVRVN